MNGSEVLPEHRDRWSRNQRLYETLKGMGLYVSPMPEPDDPTKIREMIVAADLPFKHPAQQPTEPGVSGTMQGPHVRNVIEAAESGGVNVIQFPAVK
jgi:hypothetical protein